MTKKNHYYIFSLMVVLLIIYSNASFSQVWKTFNKDNSNLQDNNVFCIAIDNKGNKWFGTEQGLVLFNGKFWTSYLNDGGKDFGNKTINDLVFESNETQSLLWIATGNGIFLLDISHPENPMYIDSFNTKNSGLAEDAIKTITIDPCHTRWFGTFQGLSGFYQNVWRNYNTQNYWIENNKVVSLASGPDSMVYIGTEGGGVSRLKTGIDAVSSASVLDKIWTGADEPEKGKLTSNNVYSILIEPNGYQWFGTDKGVALHTSYNTKRDWKNYTLKDGLINDFIQTICKDEESIFWFGTPQGVSRFNGIAWKSYTTIDGLANNNVRDIAMDKDGSLWFATENGISVRTNTTAISNIYQPDIIKISAFPNPFRLQTSIVFTLKTNSRVRINILDINGRQIIALANEMKSAGEHCLVWNRHNFAGNLVPPGMYFVQLNTEEQIITHKIVINK